MYWNISIEKDVEMTMALFCHVSGETEDGWMQKYNKISATEETGISFILNTNRVCLQLWVLKKHWNIVHTVSEDYINVLLGIICKTDRTYTIKAVAVQKIANTFINH
jgi:hypothetical protein